MDIIIQSKKTHGTSSMRLFSDLISLKGLIYKIPFHNMDSSENLDLRATSILSRLTYNINYVTLECANKSGNQIHIAGFVSSKIDAGISMPADLAPKESFAVPCLNYDALGNKDYQCQIMAAVSSTGIMIAAASAPYTYTRFDIRFFI